MRIGVNARFLLKDKLEGIGWFSYETLKRITQNHPEHEFYFFFDRPYDASFIFSNNIKPIVLFPPARHPFLYYIFFEWSITQTLKKYKIDYFISPDGFLSLSTKVPSLAVIHDIAFEHRDNDVDKLTLNYYRYFFPKFARKADRIATVSEYTKNDLLNTYKINQDKIDVVYNGANESYQPLNLDQINYTKHKFSGGFDYFIYVGSLNPRKNIANLLKSFDLFKESDITNTKLLIVGKVMVNDNHFKKEFESMKFKSDVIFTGRLSNDDLHLTLGSAKALVYIPFFEGFGIPVLESFYCNTPVITSNTTSLPEVAADAAILVDPNDIQLISSAMHNILKPEIQDDLKSKMQLRKLDFTWNKTADLLWSSLQKMISQNKSN